MDDIAEVKAAVDDLVTTAKDRFQNIDGDLKKIADRQDLIETVLNRSVKYNVNAPEPEVAREHKVVADFLRRGGPHETLSAYIERTGEYKALTVGSDADGGYTVLPTLSPMILETVKLMSPIRQYARIETISGDAFEEPQNRDTAGVAWVEETQSRSQTTAPTFAMARIPVHELMAMPAATQKLLDDNRYGIEDWLVRKIAEAFAIEEGLQFCTGNGVGKPRGIWTYPTAATGDDSRAWATFEHIATGASGAFAASATAIDVFHDTISKLKTPHLANARWFMNRSTRAAVGKIKDADNRSLVQDNLAGAVPPTLLGYPIVVIEHAPAIAANSLSIAFGDMRATYCIVDRMGIRILRDPFTSKPYVLFYSTIRRGADVLSFESLKYIKFSSS